VLRQTVSSMPRSAAHVSSSARFSEQTFGSHSKGPGPRAAMFTQPLRWSIPLFTLTT
jgi:hypothetical protein